MKNLKTFESFSINEEEGIRKFFTGHDSSEDRDKAMIDKTTALNYNFQVFHKALYEAEAEVEKDPKNYVFNKESLVKKAKEDNYKGGLRIQRGGRDPRIYVVYDKGVTGFQDIDGAASRARNINR